MIIGSNKLTSLKFVDIASKITFIKLTLFLIFLVTPDSEIHAGDDTLDITWFGTSTINISDGKTAIFFDPFISRPNLWETLTTKISSNPKQVNKWLSKIDKQNIKAIFVSHTHYDHSLDLVEVAKNTNSAIYGSKSACNIAIGGGIDSNRIYEISVDSEPIIIGDFSIFVLRAKHAPHLRLFNFTLADGDITQPLDTSARVFKYCMGENFSFYITHRLGNILFHPSGEPLLEKPNNFNGHIKADIVIQGIANRTNTQVLVNKVLKPTETKTIIPVHFDTFSKPLRKGPIPLMSSDLDEFCKTISKHFADITIPKLNYGEIFKYQKSASNVNGKYTPFCDERN